MMRTDLDCYVSCSQCSSELANCTTLFVLSSLSHLFAMCVDVYCKQSHMGCVRHNYCENGTNAFDAQRKCRNHRDCFVSFPNKIGIVWNRKIIICSSMVTSVCVTSEYRIITHSYVRFDHKILL